MRKRVGSSMRTRQSAAEEREARLERYSFSRGSGYLRCPKANDYRYTQKLLPMRDAFQLTRGSMIHAGLEAATRAQFAGERGDHVCDAAVTKVAEFHDEYLSDPFVASLVEDSEELQDVYQALKELSQSVCVRVINAHGLNTDRWETVSLKGVPLIEYDMEIVVDGLPVHCKVDWVVEDTNTGLVYECDFKTKKQFARHEDDVFNAQHPMYMYALAQYGIHVDGSMTFQIKAAVPDIPTLNKPTKKAPKVMSRRAITTNWVTYHEALIAEDLDPEDYLDMRDKLGDFERMHPIQRTMGECAAIWRDQVGLLLAIRDKTVPVTRVLNPLTCNRCEYNELCMEELRGHVVPENELGLFGLTSRKQRLETR